MVFDNDSFFIMFNIKQLIKTSCFLLKLSCFDKHGESAKRTQSCTENKNDRFLARMNWSF